ncbi:MAG TPA: hypothetical protein H9881_14905 [Candidatus Stackebrandtia excrementipullorum]|nr:hypothetical protein [Candidatus Stackebrandtia excrementipullorum]
MAPVDETSPDESAQAILAAAVGAARYAPSIHNTQPWLWQTADARITLSANPQRLLAASDPSGRMLRISCGASLAYALAAIAAQGYEAVVSRFPDTEGSDMLATVEVGAPVGVSREHADWFTSVMRRRTDRRPLRAPAPTRKQVEAIQRAAEGEECRLQPLRADQVGRLASMADTAFHLEADDVDRQRELAEWVAVGDDAPGVPAATIPAAGGKYRVRPRFTSGSLTTGAGSDVAAAYLLLFTDTDDHLAWLRAGEAMVAAWVTANIEGLSVMPLSSVVEMAVTRLGLYQLLPGGGHPQLILRVGHPDTTVEPPPTPRDRMVPVAT